jgi:hypothetical protein
MIHPSLPLTADSVPSPISDFLHALNSCALDALQPLYCSPTTPVPAVEALTHVGQLYAKPLTRHGVSFVYGEVSDIDRDQCEDSRVPCNLILYNPETRTVRYFWRLPGFATTKEVQPLAQVFDMKLDALVEAPSDTWELIHCNAEAIPTLGDLEAVYCGDDEPEPDPGAGGEIASEAFVEVAESVEGAIADHAPSGIYDVGEEYADAKVLRPYIEDNYLQNFTVTLGPKKDSLKWKPQTMPLGAFMAKLAQHQTGKKDGPAYVLGELIPGQRLKPSVKSCTGIGLDLDTGIPSHVVDAALLKLGVTAIRYTTHSHFKDESEFKRDKIKKFAPNVDIDTDLIRRFLLEDQHWERSIVDSAVFEKFDHTDRGIMAVISHNPMPKHRVVIPLATAFEIATEGETQRDAADKWAKIIDSTANKLGLPYDHACTDVSRLFLFPRHDAERPFEISLFGGPLFDWHTLELDNALDSNVKEWDKTKSKSVTPEGRELGRWSITKAPGFQIADVIEAYAPDRIRGSASQGFEIECPFDEDHSNAGERDDRACFVVNAGYGQSEIFTISCRHESCRNKTNLDMLGKMLKDGWFDKAVLDDEQYNSIVDEKPGKAPDSDNSASKETILKSIQSDIGQLSTDSETKLEDARRIILAMAAAKPDGLWAKQEVRHIRDRTKLDFNELWKLYKESKPKEIVSARTKKDLEKLEARVCEIMGEELYYPPNLGTIILDVHEGRPYLIKEGEEYAAPLCSPIIIAGGVRYADRDQERGLRIKFLNAENECVVTEIPARFLAQKSGVDLFTQLRGGGWAGGYEGEMFVLEYLKHAQPPAIEVFDTGGWKGEAYLFLSGESVPASARLELSPRIKLPGSPKVGTADGAKAATDALFANEKLLPLQACYLGGLAGVVAGAAKDSTLQYSLEGPSTKGKSTAEMVGVSHYGDPRLTKEKDKIGGLFFDANGTVNSQVEVIKRCAGGAAALDEIGKLGAKAGQELVFMVNSGMDKRRQNKDGSARATVSWTGGTLFMSAEVGFSQRLAQEGVVQTGGLTVRALPIQVGPEHEVSEEEWKPVSALLDNYGHTGPAFVRAMIEQGWSSDPALIEARIENRAGFGGYG